MSGTWVRPRVRVAAILAAVTTVIAVATAGWWYWAGRPKPITVTAQFDSAAGLYEGNVVAVLGMPVGKITTITPRGSYVEVVFTVDRDVKVPADAQAVTVSTSILTERQIELTPPYTGGPALANHDTIGLTRTRTPVEFSRVLSVLDRVATSLRGDGHGGGPLADVIDGGAGVVDGNGAKIKQALDQLSAALRLSGDDGSQTREQVTTIVRNLSSLLEAAAANDATLREFASTLHLASQVIGDEDLGTGTTGRKLNQLIQQSADLLDAHRDTIKQTVVNGGTLAKTAADNQREIAELLDLAPMVADNIYNSIDQSNGALRGHALVDKIVFDSQWTKEVCNLMGLRQLGCSTGTLQDFGPDFGLTYVLDGMAAMGQK
ncbi:MCE family protein [Mycolicibacterium sp. CBM1]